MDNQPITPEIPPTPSGSFNPDSFGSTTPKSKASVIAIVVILVMITFSIGMFFFVFSMANNMIDKTTDSIQTTFENNSKKLAEQGENLPFKDDSGDSTTKKRVMEGCYEESDLVGAWLHEPDYEMVFWENGKGVYSYSAKEFKFKYRVDGCSILVMEYDGTTKPNKTLMRIEDDTLIILDSYGEEVDYKKQ